MNNTIEMNGMLWVVGRECWRAEKWGSTTSRSPTTTGSTRASATRLVLEVGVKNRILCRETLREKFRRNHPHLSRDAWTGRLDLARALNSGGSHSILAITISNYKYIHITAKVGSSCSTTIVLMVVLISTLVLPLVQPNTLPKLFWTRSSQMWSNHQD